MSRRKWVALLAGGALLLFSAVVISMRRALEAPSAGKGVSLDALADVYGLVDRIFGRPFRQLTVRLAGVREGAAVLDVGCGPGTLTVMEKETAGRSGYVAGIDIAPRMIAKGREQAAKSGLDVDFRVASIDALPFPGASFDVVTSSFMVHHLPTEVKRAGFKEVYRVLKPGGRYLIVDFPSSRGVIGALSLLLARLLALVLEEEKYSLDLLEGKVPQMLRDAGFSGVGEVGGYRVAGIMPASFIKATKVV